MTHSIHVGIGGWTFEPWRGVFYPEGLVQKRELEYAASKLTSIEINGTYYSTFKPDSWKKWRDETPDGFVFSVKASRYCTNRKVLSEGAESFDKFLSQGLTELGDKLGPINWQFIPWETIKQHLILVRYAGQSLLLHALFQRGPARGRLASASATGG
ncbi:DUF72 domain-containing protein [Brevundimonas vesicularis]|uniref:DUF72 domain-containing protein n=1 Tax=Brevundimonas vesicularis TaxID=41276 RepID=UPI0029C02CE6|nr:DUF72 domain-containing protein [Brevundimonas vesicularis]